ncbi:MAG: tRNA (adenosine(37)-N6)-dimethylallyltransferase MiaA [Gammaproteobacteria bacterium]|jgi:tRNA dimethylallyltransferase|nr:tRNA (adenosine(37)-N6)-dimethylallyltransferase MiaA [Gammaproteobacteria bacterium]
MTDDQQDLPVVFLMGPTASGKTALAVELCQHLPFEIISVDSAMVYKGMDIGTAKPTADILAKTPHRLIDLCDPSEVYSAGNFREDALKEIKSIHALNKIPLLVGGTGLYFRALEKGIAALPSADASVRQKLTEEAAASSWQLMHERLRKVDPDSAERIHPNDPQRIQRALEVYEVSGRTLSSYFKADDSRVIPYPCKKIIIAPEDRSVLHERIRCRYEEMLKLGLVNEVEGLYQRGDLSLEKPSMRTVGYRQVWQFLQGELGESEMLEKAVVATRQLAKRQLTWLRSEQDASWFDCMEADFATKALRFLSDDPILSVKV